MSSQSYYGMFDDSRVYEWKTAVSLIGRGGESFLKHAVQTGLKIHRKGELRFFSGFHFRMWLEEAATREGDE